MVEIRCPGNKKHYKRSGNLVVAEKCCNSLLGFIDNSVDKSVFQRRCNDCKSVVGIRVDKGTVYVKLQPKETMIKTQLGRVVVEDDES